MDNSQLTDEQIDALAYRFGGTEYAHRKFARAIESAIAEQAPAPEETINRIIELACEAKHGWLDSQSDDGTKGTMGAAIYHARKAEIRSILAGARK